MSRPFAPRPAAPADGAPDLSIGAWRGPLALLVELARRQRIDLKVVSMVELVDACLASLGAFARIEDRADQLLMIADLTLMKSRLLMGGAAETQDEEDRLRQQALALQRIQRVAALLMDRDQLGQDIWARGAPELEADQAARAADDVALIDVIRAYARLRLKEGADAPVALRRILAMTLRDALESLGGRLDELDDWTELFAWAGQGARAEGVTARSQAAASFVAALEMAKRGDVEIRQRDAFEDITVAKGERASVHSTRRQPALRAASSSSGVSMRPAPTLSRKSPIGSD